MSRRTRLATLFVIAAVGLGIFFLFRGAPTERAVTYDLGELHTSVVRLEVRVTVEGEPARQVEWFFEPGAAPRRVNHRATLPADVLDFEIIIEDDEGRIYEERREVDWREPGDVTLFVEPGELG